MQSKPKSNSVVTTSYDVEKATWTFEVAGAEPVFLHRSVVSAEVLERALIEGMSDRIADKAAKSRDPETGRPAIPGVKRAAMQSLADFYETGTPNWSMVRQSFAREKALESVEQIREEIARLQTKLNAKIG